MRALKTILYVLAGCVAIIVIAGVGITLFFDPNRYKPEIEQWVEQQTHRKLTLEGNLKLSFFPWLAIQMGPAQLSERASFGTQPFISMRGARLSMRVWPLLRGNVEVGSIELDEPSIRLITNEQGQHNWSDLAKQEAKQDTTNTISKDDHAVTHNLRLAGIAIRDGAVVLEDRKANTRQALEHFTLTTGAISNNQPFNLKMSLEWVQKDSAPLPIQLNARVTADFTQAKYKLDALDFTAHWPGANNHSVPVTLHADTLQIDLNQQLLDMLGLAINTGKLRLTGQVSGKEIFDAAHWQGTLSFAPIALRPTLHELGIELPLTRDVNVLQQFSMEAGFTATNTSLSLKPVQLKLDETTLKGELSIVDFASTALRFDLAIDRINFDRYLPPIENKVKSSTTQGSAPTPIPVDALRTLNARGTLHVGEAIFSNVHFDKVQLGINARDGALKLQPTDASLYGGEYHGVVALDVTQSPKLSIESHAARIDFAPLFKDLFDSKKINGHGDFNIKATATGKDTAVMLRALNGALDFTVHDGAYQGIDLWYEVRRARALFRKEPVPERSGAERTEFTSCRGTGVISNGVLSNNDLDIATQFLKITGQGTADIVDDKINYRLIANVLRIPKEGEVANSDLIDAKIPITVTGALSDPKMRPDIEGLLKEEGKKKVDEKKQELKEKLRSKLKGLLGG